MKMRLSNSDYWDLFLCYDCTDEQDNNQILDDCILVDIDINNDNSFSGDTLYSLTTWTGATINGSGITLNDIGLTGIDNGFILYDCTGSTSGQTFLSAFTGSTLVLTSADTIFSMTRVTGCTYEYPIEILSGASEGRYAQLCGGFYQGFFKLSDKTYFEEISDNKFTWPLEWFTCPPVCTGDTTVPSGQTCCLNPNLAYQCYNDGKPIPYNYEILPERLGGMGGELKSCLDGWTATFLLNKSSESCTGNTLNNLYPNNKGFFFYMGTRAENKFWDLFSGETGYTTSSGYPLPPPKETTTELNNNPFLVYQPAGCCCFTGITTETTQEKDRNIDLLDNALGFLIKDDGSIGFRRVNLTSICSAVTETYTVDCNEQCGCGCSCEDGIKTGITTTTKYLTGLTINECYSDTNLINEDEWTHVAIRFKPYESYEDCKLNFIPQRKGSLTVYINGFLKWKLDDFDEFIFKELNEHREKQQGVPFNYSLGGGTQGLIESNTVNGPDVKDKSLFLEQNFSGTFEGGISTFKLYGCSLDITTIRDEYASYTSNFGLDTYEPPIILDDDLLITITTSVDSGSTILNYLFELDKPFDEDHDFEFTTYLEYGTHGSIQVDNMVTIPKGKVVVTYTKRLEYDFDDLVEVSENKKIKNSKVKINNKNINITQNTKNSKVIYIKELTKNNNSNNGNSGNNSNNGNVKNEIVYYGKLESQTFSESDLDKLSQIDTTNIINTHIQYDNTPGYCYLLVPVEYVQPNLIKNSEDGCNGFVIPFLSFGQKSIFINNKTFEYNVYRSFVLTYSVVDTWICD